MTRKWRIRVRTGLVLIGLQLTIYGLIRNPPPFSILEWVGASVLFMIVLVPVVGWALEEW